MNSPLIRAGLIVAIIPIILVAASCTKTEQRQPPGQTATDGTGAATGVSEAIPDTGGVPYDLGFIDAMTAHHGQAVMMARMAGTRAEHAELRDLAARMVSDQEAEIARMKSWRDMWYPGRAAVPQSEMMHMPGMPDTMPMMDMDHMGTMSGAAFDRMFIQMMIPHHQDAVTMSRDALSRAEHQEIRDLAQEIINEQEQEIDQMNTWKSTWFTP
jgi:uncharacterized protein (DUF305 family)